MSPEPSSRFSVRSTPWLLLLPALQPACGLQLDRRVSRKIKYTVLDFGEQTQPSRHLKRKRSGNPSCFLFGRCSCEATTSFCSCQHCSWLAVCRWIKEWEFGTVHTTKPFAGKNDSGYPVSPEATGPRPSMQSTGNNAEITPEDYSGSSVVLVVISDIE